MQGQLLNSLRDAPVRSRDPHPRWSRRLSARLYRQPRLSLWLLLLPPLAWFLLLYVGPLAGLLLNSVYTFDEFSMTVTQQLTTANLQALVTEPSHLDIALRSFTMAVAVSAACLLL